ncbi:MAG: hypothetical protein V4543_03815 [Bacteroidota bacterium]
MPPHPAFTENYIGYAHLPLHWLPAMLFSGSAGNVPEPVTIPWAGELNNTVLPYLQGIEACNMAGGIHALVSAALMQRCPVFSFGGMPEAHAFAESVKAMLPELQALVRTTGRYVQLQNLQTYTEGNFCTLMLSFTTGDAAGQNMATISTDALCRMLQAHFGLPKGSWFIEGNMSGDKKYSSASFLITRGRRVNASVSLPAALLAEKGLSAKSIVALWQSDAARFIRAGEKGNVFGIAGPVSAVFTATGQDVACVAESALGLLRVQENNQNLDVYLTLPGLPVGSVGGGTALPAAKAILQTLDCAGEGKANRLAEIIGAFLLAGEVGKMLGV